MRHRPRASRLHRQPRLGTVTLFGAGFNTEEVIKRSHAILTQIDAELSDRQWIAADRPTIADVALYSYIAAPEGNVDISGYEHLNAWLRRIEALPGFFPFEQNPVGLRAAA